MKTTINGKEIKLFGMAEISAIYTQTIQSYLAQGFVFAVGEFCRGSQGETAKVDLTNDGGKTVYRVWLYGSYHSDISHRRSCDILNVVVKKYENVHENSTIWYSEGVVVSQKTFWSIGERWSKKVYVETEEEFDIINNIRNERIRRHYEIGDYVTLNNVSKKVVFNLAKKQKGYKSILLKDIQSVQRRIGKGYYKINIANRSYLLLEIAK